MIFGKYINKYYKKYWYFFLIAFICIVAVDYVQLYIPEYLGQIVGLFSENYVADEIAKEVSIISIKVLAIAFALMIGRCVWRITLFGASKRIEANLREEMFDKAMRLSRDYYHKNNVGTIMAWFTNDIETIEEFFSWGTLSLIDAIFLSIFVIVKMFILDYALALLVLLPLIFIVIWGMLVEKFMSEKWKQRQEAFDKLYDFSDENFTGIRVIKAFVKETNELHQFAKIAKKNKDINVSFSRMAIIFDVVIEILLALIIAFIFGFGGFLVFKCVKAEPIQIFSLTITSTLSSEKLITFTGYFDSIIWPMIALGQVITMRARAKSSLKRITNFLDSEEDIKNSENPIVLNNPKGKICFKDFSFKYKDNKEDMLKHINLEIESGQKIGIVGRIGSGKTTIVNVLCRFYNVNRNSLFIDDVDIMDIDLSCLHKIVAYAPQDNFLFSDDIKTNISFSNKDLDIGKIKEAAKFASIDEDISNFENGYETKCGERGSTLSGGQKQRISLARAYIKNSPILILDDCVSAVDMKTEEIILNNIAKYRKDKTTIIIASRISSVASFDKIIVLNDGELEAFDTPANLTKISPTYQKMAKSQELEQKLKEGKNNG